MGGPARTCFVPLCKVNTHTVNAHAFRSPPNALGDWIRILTKIRADTTYDRNKHYVCHLHFEEGAIIKADEFLIGGEKVYLQRCHWKLKDDAIPTIFPNFPSYRQITIKKRKPPKDRSNLVPKKKKVISSDVQNSKGEGSSPNKRRTLEPKNKNINEQNLKCVNSSQTIAASSKQQESNAKGKTNVGSKKKLAINVKKAQVLNDNGLPKIISCETLNAEAKKTMETVCDVERFPCDDRSQIREIGENAELELDDIVNRWDEKRFPGWFLVPETENGEIKALHLIQFRFKKQAAIGKSIKIFGNLQFEVRVRNQDVISWVRKHFCDDKLEHIESVWNLLKLFSSFSECVGVSGFEKTASCKKGYLEGEIWYSKECHIIGESVMCVPCRLLQAGLTSKLYRDSCNPIPKKELKKLAKDKQYRKQQRQLKGLNNRVSGLTKRKELQNEVIRNLKSEITLLKRNATSIVF